MNIKIVYVGNKPSAILDELICDYTKRLPRSIKCSWVSIKHGSGGISNSKQYESENILKHINQNSYVFLLDESGKQLNSVELSIQLFSISKDIVFIIGGAYGVAEDVKIRADFIWSLSELVLPHQLVKLVLAEQIYRAHTIATNHPYHHS